MNLLLDTHVWLWFAQGNKSLSLTLRRAIEKKSSVLWISPISVWETLILAEKGRIKCSIDSRSWISKLILALDHKEAPLTTQIALRSREITLPHEDPADRILVATALELGLTLATQDETLIEAGVVETIS